MSKLLTIGMSTYDDFDGVFFSIQAMKMYHPICKTNYVEFIIFDNNPDGKHSQDLIKFASSHQDVRYLTHKEAVPTSFSKYRINEFAMGKYVLIIDSHVLVVDGGIRSLLSYFYKHPNCKDLIQGPLLYDDLNNVSTHFEPQWRGHMYGTWATNREAMNKGEPFEIPMQGMGLLAYEREYWPGIGKHFVGFGGEEGYIAEKFRQNGGKNLCLPQLMWNHRFYRPNGVPYPLRLEDRVWNYLVGWLELGGSNHPMVKDTYQYFKPLLPNGVIDQIYNNALCIMESKSDVVPAN